MIRSFLKLMIPILFPLYISAGTLIVTYYTGSQGERLDRIRFILSEPKQSQQMYPKGESFIDDPTSFSRMVVVENLQPGEYTLEFVIPNSDGFFEDVPPRKVTINETGVVKVDQPIKIRYSGVRALAQVKGTNFPGRLPLITLRDSKDEVKAQSSQGNLNATQLVPGKYTVVFEPFMDFQSPPAIPVSLKPGETLGPFIGTYKK